MKSISTYINEKLNVNSTKQKYNYSPKSYDELHDTIGEMIARNGNNTDLNAIDVSNITDLGALFFEDFSEFNGDVSEWDVSNVELMNQMFKGCIRFNCDISKWNVSNCEQMCEMFAGCKNFNADLSGWDVSKVDNMHNMFTGCKKFNSDLSKWDVSSLEDSSKCREMFDQCKTLEEHNLIPEWYFKISKIEHKIPKLEVDGRHFAKYRHYN